MLSSLYSIYCNRISLAIHQILRIYIYIYIYIYIDTHSSPRFCSIIRHILDLPVISESITILPLYLMYNSHNATKQTQNLNMFHSLHSTEVHVHFFTSTEWNLLFFIATTFRMAGYVGFCNSAFHLQRMPKSSIQFLNGNKKWPHILSDPSLLCCILTNLQLHSVSANKFDIVYLLNSFGVLMFIIVMSQ